MSPKIPQKIVALLDKWYELTPVDYQDNLSENLVMVQQAIRDQDTQCIDEMIEDWYGEGRCQSVDYALDERLRDAITSEFNVDNERAARFIDKYRDDLENIVYERDNSDPVTDLLRHTPDQPAFYDTGFEVLSGCWKDDKALKDDIKSVKRTLKIPGRVDTWDGNISMMLQQAPYGGLLVVYWYADLADLLKIGHPVTATAANTIEFKNPMIAVIDTVNGSGDSTALDGHSFTLPLNLDNIFIDATLKYNYTYAVCGMSSNWCKCTKVKFSRTRNQKPAERSAMNDLQDQEKKHNEVYAAGGCTFGDVDYNRHRNTDRKSVV